jgi:hypothetical protein
MTGIGISAVGTSSTSSFISSVVSGVTVAACVTVSYITPNSQVASPTAEVKIPVSAALPTMAAVQVPPTPLIPSIPSFSGIMLPLQGLQLPMQPIISVNVTVQKAPETMPTTPPPPTQVVQTAATAAPQATVNAPLPEALKQELKAFAEHNNLPPETTKELEKGVSTAMHDFANQMQNGPVGNAEKSPQQGNAQNNPSNEGPAGGPAGAPPPPPGMANPLGAPSLGAMPNMPAPGEMPALPPLPGMPNMPAMPEGLARAFTAIQNLPALPPGIGSAPIIPSLPANFNLAEAEAAFQAWLASQGGNLPPPPPPPPPPPIVP